MEEYSANTLIYCEFGPKLHEWIDSFVTDAGVKGGVWEMTQDQYQMVLHRLQNMVEHIKEVAEDHGFELKDLDPDE